MVCIMQAVKQHWDQNGVRYRLLKSVSGQDYNWLFFPGGPGFDSRYLLSQWKSLVQILMMILL